MKHSIPWKAYILLSFILLFFAAIIGRLFFLQVIEHKLYAAQALGQQVTLQDVTGNRGQIYCEESGDTKGVGPASQVKSLAINEDQWLVSVNPKDIPDKNAFANSLSAYLGLTKDQIFSLVSTQDAYVV